MESSQRRRIINVIVVGWILMVHATPQIAIIVIHYVLNGEHTAICGRVMKKLLGQHSLLFQNQKEPQALQHQYQDDVGEFV